MIDQRAASRYAQALFGLAEEEKQAESIDKELFHVREILGKYPEVTHLVLNSTVAFEEKADFLEKVFPSSISLLTRNFLNVLVRKKRFAEFSAIQESYHRLFEKARGIKEVIAISRTRLSAEAETRLRQVLEKKLKAKIRMLSEVDPEMIGGLVLRFDGTEINASFKQRLLEIRQSLMA